MEYDNTNRGVLFKNDRKNTDRHPDYTGNINFDGTECWLSAWIKTSKAGKKFMSLAVTPKEPNIQNDDDDDEPQQSLGYGETNEEENEDVPF